MASGPTAKVDFSLGLARRLLVIFNLRDSSGSVGIVKSTLMMHKNPIVWIGFEEVGGNPC